MYHSAAHIVFEAAKSRVYRFEEDGKAKGDSSRAKGGQVNTPEITPVLEELPKWKALLEIIDEIIDDESSEKPVLIFCSDEFTCEQLKKVITPNGPHDFMSDMYLGYLASKTEVKSQAGKKRNAKGKPVPMLLTENGIEEAALSKEAHSIGLSREQGPPTGKAEHTDVTKPDSIESWFDKRLHFVPSDCVGALKLWQDLPERIIMYDPDIALTRQIELYAAQNSKVPLRVYLLRYEASPEMDKYQNMVLRERKAFEDLIQSKGSMARRVSVNSNTRFLPIERADNSISANTVTRKGGGRQSLSSSEKIRVIVDVREFMSPFPAVLHYQGFHIIPVTLEVGDFVLSPEICVERKSIPDLRSSLMSGRLYQQAESMCKYYQIAILLIEFDGDKAFALQSTSELGDDIQANHIMSRLVLLCLHHPRLRLIWSRSLHATADIFRQLKANHEEPDPIVASNVGLEGASTSGKDPAVNNAALEVLRRLPGVTESNLKPLAREAGSLSGLANLPLEKLEEILGSKVSGKRLHDFLHQKPSF